MSQEIRVGGTYQCKVGKNMLNVKVVRKREENGYVVETPTGKHVIVLEAERLQPAAAAEKKKRVSLVDAAIIVLREKGEAMNTKDIVTAVNAKGLWNSPGKTPAATLYSAILRDLGKGSAARFTKAAPGKFAAK